jgi:hypothetical protein
MGGGSSSERVVLPPYLLQTSAESSVKAKLATKANGEFFAVLASMIVSGGERAVPPYRFSSKTVWRCRRCRRRDYTKTKDKGLYGGGDHTRFMSSGQGKPLSLPSDDVDG